MFFSQQSRWRLLAITTALFAFGCGDDPPEPPDSGAQAAPDAGSDLDDAGPALPDAMVQPADLIVHNALVTTQDPALPNAEAIAVLGNRVLAVGDNASILAHRGDATVVLDAQGRRLIPGLNDNHVHLSTGGANYNLNVKWDGVPTLAMALEMLAEQAERTPDGAWVTAIGGWSPHQFEEDRFPTFAELNAAVPNHPVVIQHAYNVALMNQRALDGFAAAVGVERIDYIPFPETTWVTDTEGNLTGEVRGEPASWVFFALEFLVPLPTPEQAVNGTQQLLKELNRLGITSVTDAGATESYPFANALNTVIQNDDLTVRVSFLELPKSDSVDDAIEALTVTAPIEVGENLHPFMEYGFTFEGIGELLFTDTQNFTTLSDWENFSAPTYVVDPDVIREVGTREIMKLAQHGLPFRIHVTFDENVGPMLDAIEAVNEEIPVGDLRWTLEHAETISPANIERVRALGGSVGVQGRLAMHGDDLRNTQGTEVAAAAAPLRRLVDAGLHMSLGTDGLRANTLNPWLTLFWATTGRSISGAQIMDRNNVLSRSEALEAYTLGSAYYQHQESIKGRLTAGQLADFALLSDDFFEVSDESISDIHSVLTVVDGEVVYGEGPYAEEARSVPAPIPTWSPVHHWPGYHVPE